MIMMKMIKMMTTMSPSSFLRRRRRRQFLLFVGLVATVLMTILTSTSSNITTPSLRSLQVSSRSVEYNDEYNNYYYYNQNPLPHSVAICAIQKGGGRYLEEWIDYNALLGFDKIYLYDNSDDYELQDWTYDYYDNTDKKNKDDDSSSSFLDIVHFPGQKKQLSAYKHCANRIQREQLHTWVAFFDLDEFLVLKQHDVVSELIDDVLQKNQQQQQSVVIVGGIAINWYVFDYNNHTHYEPLPMTYRFQRRRDSVDQHVKTIVNIAHFHQSTTPHAFSYRNAAVAVDTHGNILKQPTTWFHPDGPTDVAVLHHMNFKSVQEYHDRCARGRADVIEHFQQPSSSSAAAQEQQQSPQLPYYCRSEDEILNQFEQLAATTPMVQDSAAWDVLVEGMPHKYGGGSGGGGSVSYSSQ